jgi:hypothetical protein
MSYYIIFIVYFVYCVLDNLMPVATHGYEPSATRSHKHRISSNDALLRNDEYSGNASVA